jgi:hypothetical protein
MLSIWLGQRGHCIGSVDGGHGIDHLICLARDSNTGRTVVVKVCGIAARADADERGVQISTQEPVTGPVVLI